jgi:hypothetical protein
VWGIERGGTDRFDASFVDRPGRDRDEPGGSDAVRAGELRLDDSAGSRVVDVH